MAPANATDLPAGTPLPPLVRLAAASAGLDAAITVTARVQILIRGKPVCFEITVPRRPVPLMDLLPVFQGIADVMVEFAARNGEQGGHVISCREGCGACCRQPVPISESEARALRDLVDSRPEPRRSLLRARFREAQDRLAAAGLAEAFLHPAPAALSRKQELALAYFRLGIACPFLEAECCSIHPARPIACREYLVTSPAACCAQPTPDSIRVLSLPSKVSSLLRAMDQSSGQPASANRAGWLALALALRWTEAQAEEPVFRPGPAWVEGFFRLFV